MPAQIGSFTFTPMVFQNKNIPQWMLFEGEDRDTKVKCES